MFLGAVKELLPQKPALDGLPLLHKLPWPRALSTLELSILLLHQILQKLRLHVP